MSISLNISESIFETELLLENGRKLIETSLEVTSEDKHTILRLLDKTMQEEKNEKTIFGILSNVARTICDEKNWIVMDEVLNHKLIKSNPHEVLYILIKNYNENEMFLQCFDKLLHSKTVDINNVDSFGYPLIDHALSIGADSLVKSLLRAGAFIGHYNGSRDSFTVEEINPELLKEFFDECVTSNQNIPSHEKNYEINFNYKNFIPPNSKTNEMDPFMRIVDDKKLLDLLKHPLVTSFFLLKWQRIALFFYINFWLFGFFGFSVVEYILFSYLPMPPFVVKWFFWNSVIGIAYMIVRELKQLRKPKQYFQTLNNYLGMLMISFCITTISIDDIRSSAGKSIAVITIILMAVELCILVGSLPVLSISTHMLMLEEVMKSFLKSFALYLIFILMFALCFFVLIGKEVDDENSKPRIDVKEADGHTQMFSNIFKSVVKVMAMFTGELDLENLGLKTPISYILFMIFIICITIVLMNLLNGLAVSDTQAIREQAGLNEMICRAKVLYSYDCNLFPLVNDDKDLNIKQCFCGTSVRVLPNYEHLNFVVDPRKNRCLACGGENEVKKSKPRAEEWMEWMDNIKQKKFQAIVRSEDVRLFTDCFIRRSTIMDSNTIKAANDVLAKKDLAKKKMVHLEEAKKNSENHEIRMRNIEENMKKMLQLLMNKHQ